MNKKRLREAETKDILKTKKANKDRKSKIWNAKNCNLNLKINIYKERYITFIRLRSRVKGLTDDCIKTAFKKTNNNNHDNNDKKIITIKRNKAITEQKNKALLSKRLNM